MEYGHKHSAELEYFGGNRMCPDWLLIRSRQDKLTVEEHGVWTQTSSRAEECYRNRKC